MRKQETLHLLSQVKEAELLRLRLELAQAQAATLRETNRYDEQCAAACALAVELETTRREGVATLKDGPLSALQQQTQYRHVAKLTEALSRAKAETATRKKAMAEAETRTSELRKRLSVTLGQREGISGMVESEERRAALRLERALDDALTDQWTSRAR